MFKLFIYHYKKFYVFPFWLILFFFSLIYKLIIKIQRKKGYQFKFADIFIFSIGNITTGGTGKTEVAAYLSALFESKNKAAIILRGYKGKYKETFQIISKKSSYKDVGDEAILLSNRTKNIVITAKKRIYGIQQAIKKKKKIIILDDAYQHWNVQRNMNIVLIDYTNPFGNGHVLPAGNLREPKKALIDADLVLVTKCNENDDRRLANLKVEIKKHSFCPVYTSKYKFNGIYKKNKKIVLNKLMNKKLLVVSGIGNPEYFVQQIQDHLEPAEIKVINYKDHYQYKDKDIKKWNKLLDQGFDHVITTEKDYVRMQEFDIHPLVFRIQLELKEKIKFNQYIRKLLYNN